MELNNPASRLLELLRELKRANPGTATGHVLSGVFGVDATASQLFPAIAEFHMLVNSVLDLVTRQNSLSSAPFLRLLPDIRSAVEYTNLDAAWSMYAGRITSECLLVIEMFAHLPDVVQDKVPPESDLAELKNDLNELFEFVVQSKQLEPEFRTFILQQIEQIRRCLAEYRISGNAGFIRFLESFVFQSDRHRSSIERTAAASPGAIKGFRKVLSGVKKFLEYSSDGIAVLKQAGKFYKDGGALLEDFSPRNTGELPEAPGIEMA